MIVSEKPNQNLSDHIQFLFEKRFQVNRKVIISSEKIYIQVIMSKIMLTRSLDRNLLSEFRQ